MTVVMNHQHSKLLGGATKSRKAQLPILTLTDQMQKRY